MSCMQTTPINKTISVDGQYKPINRCRIYNFNMAHCAYCSEDQEAYFYESPYSHLHGIWACDMHKDCAHDDIVNGSNGCYAYITPDRLKKLKLHDSMLIKRSNGDIETGWTLAYNTMSLCDDVNISKLSKIFSKDNVGWHIIMTKKTKHDDKCILRMCYLSTLFEINKIDMTDVNVDKILGTLY